MPNALASSATRWPSTPSPTMPSRAPPRSWIGWLKKQNCPDLCHSPASVSSDPLPSHPPPAEPEPRPAEVVDRVVEEADLPRPLPLPRQRVLAVRDDAAAERQHQRERVLRNRAERVAADVRYGDAVGLAP